MNIVKCDISGHELLLPNITFFRFLTYGLCYTRWLPCLAVVHHATDYWMDAHRIRTGSSVLMSLFIFIMSSVGPIERSNSIGPTEGIMNIVHVTKTGHMNNLEILHVYVETKITTK